MGQNIGMFPWQYIAPALVILGIVVTGIAYELHIKKTTRR